MVVGQFSDEVGEGGSVERETDDGSLCVHICRANVLPLERDFAKVLALGLLGHLFLVSVFLDGDSHFAALDDEEQITLRSLADDARAVFEVLLFQAITNFVQFCFWQFFEVLNARNELVALLVLLLSGRFDDDLEQGTFETPEGHVRLRLDRRRSSTVVQYRQLAEQSSGAKIANILLLRANSLKK